MSADLPPGADQLGAANVPYGRDAPALARSLVSRWLDDHRDGALLGDACLLVTELVTNSLRHAEQPDGARLHVSAAALNGHVRVTVQDHGNGPVRRRAPDPHHGGFGLHLVELISTRWGVNHEHGTNVWFELTTRGRPTENQAPVGP